MAPRASIRWHTACGKPEQRHQRPPGHGLGQYRQKDVFIVDGTVKDADGSEYRTVVRAAWDFLCGCCLGVAVFYRRIMGTYTRVNIPRGFVVTTFSIATVNVTVGLSLNSVVNAGARDLVSQIASYQQKNGHFPTSLTNVMADPDLRRLKRNRLVFGAAVTYISDGKTFHLSHTRYLIGDSVWNQHTREFQPTLD
jgi:hypothetical protein